MARRIGIPVASCPFPYACAIATEIEVIPPNSITLGKDIFVICASRDLNDQPCGALWEPEFGPAVLTLDAEDSGDTELWRNSRRRCRRRCRRLRARFNRDFCFIRFL